MVLIIFQAKSTHVSLPALVGRNILSETCTGEMFFFLWKLTKLEFFLCKKGVFGIFVHNLCSKITNEFQREEKTKKSFLGVCQHTFQPKISKKIIRLETHNKK